MVHHPRHEDGKFHIQGKKYEQIRGSRRQVWHGTAYKTDGGLVKKDLLKNKWGNLVSKKLHNTAKKQKRLAKAGWFPRKDGTFGAVQRSTRRRK